MEPTLPIARALIDREGLLIEAEDRIARLNMRAGGEIGRPLAIPQLATLVRLAQRLQTLISRGVLAADGEQDLDLWVRAEPVSEGVRLAVSGWAPRPAWTPPEPDDGRALAFVRAGADWLWETDAALNLTFISADADAHDDGNLDSLLGQQLTRLFALGMDGEGNAPMLGALALRAPFADQPAMVRASGRIVRLAAVPRHDRAGRFAGFIGGARLVEQAAPTAESADADAFSAQLDRALRAPLAAIIAGAETIAAQQDGALEDSYAGYASDIATAGRHLLGLVDDLVDLQAIERADFQVASETIDLADLARRAAGLLQVRANDAKVTIDRPAVGEMLSATGEFRRVLQILVNLIGNAVRYSPSGSTVWVRAEREGDIAAVIVADQGKGIAVADQARIFEKFQRVDPTEPGGSGLGLYIARRLARAMGGDITVDSAPGQGARFLFALPARD
ncbi:MAG TPA: HAMP domain-containing sensor histidine kinase [Sphingomonas sp.]|nr:HAMP domain-containing sensor histidine kinase [Sphingomonas sp.]